MIDRQTEIFKSIIPLQARLEAENFSSYHTERNKAKQVYLNTLAVSAVNSYLNFIGWSTSLEASDSWNPILQAMMDVADLFIPSYGKLECRFVMAGQHQVNIPPEVWSERIGYAIVELEESLQYFTILGFVSKVDRIRIPLEELEPLADFPTYLSQQKRIAPIQPTILNQWFVRPPDLQWHRLEELFAAKTAFNFRSPQKLVERVENPSLAEINRVKSIDLDRENNIAIALILSVRPKEREEYNISLLVCNAQSNHLLPQGLELIILDRHSFPTMIAQTNETETIEFCFSGTLGESFSIELTFDQQILTESFII